MRLHEGQGEEG